MRITSRRWAVVLFAWVASEHAAFEAQAVAAERDDLLMLLVEGAKDNRERIMRWEWVHEVESNHRGSGKQARHATTRYHSISDGTSIWGTGRWGRQAELRRPDLYADRSAPGRDWASRGNMVRWNYIHSNAPSGGSGSQAIYLDDCDSGDTVMGNIVFGGVNRGVLLGGGRDNTIAGNIFIDLPKGIHVDARGPRGITLDKPGSWNLKAKREKLGYLSPLWKERYPRLARVLDENPLLPLGNVMRNNIFIGCKKPFALAKGVKPEWLTRENNHVWQAADFPFLPASASAGALDLKMLPKIWKEVPGFEPIPIDQIGPQGM